MLTLLGCIVLCALGCALVFLLPLIGATVVAFARLLPYLLVFWLFLRFCA